MPDARKHENQRMMTSTTTALAGNRSIHGNPNRKRNCSTYAQRITETPDLGFRENQQNTQVAGFREHSP